jgi:hypothetical protein
VTGENQTKNRGGSSLHICVALWEVLANNVFTVFVDSAFAKVFDEIVNVAPDVLNLKATKGHNRVEA